MGLVPFVIMRVGHPALHDFMLETICTIMAMEMESGVSMDTAGRYFRKPLFKHICKQKSQ